MATLSPYTQDFLRCAGEMTESRVKRMGTVDNSEPPSEHISTPTGVATYVGEAECPQCGRLGYRHTKDCPHNLGPRDGR
jgi:hypothetical protein